MLRFKEECLLGEDNLRGMRLSTRSCVLVHDARLGGLVHGRGVSVGGSLGRFLVFTGGGGDEFFVQGLEARLGRLVARGEANRLTGSLDGGFGVGHG